MQNEQLLADLSFVLSRIKTNRHAAGFEDTSLFQWMTGETAVADIG